MISIKDIYQWYNNDNSPKPPSHLTPLQKIEWEEHNSEAINEYREFYKNRTFVGEHLTSTPARIQSITKGEILATAEYIQILRIGEQPLNKKEFEKIRGPFVTTCPELELKLNFTIIYDDFFYETIKLMNNYTSVELEGQILSFSKEYARIGCKYNDLEYSHFYTWCYNIKLQLSKIKEYKYGRLYSNLLNDKHKFSDSPLCFIATAAFGDKDVSEVIQLREYRDNILKKTFIGRVFISTYYVLSPPIAFIIKRNSLLRKVTRNFIKKVVLPITINRK